MGVCGSHHLPAHAVTTQDLLENGLANVKSNMIAQYSNISMVAEIIKMLFLFVDRTLRYEPNDFMGMAFIGLHIGSGNALGPERLHKRIGHALHKLTDPQQLSFRRLDKNFLSCAHTFDEIEAHCKRSRVLRVQAAFGKEDDATLFVSGGTPMLPYKDLQKTMLAVLDPLCDMVDELLNPLMEILFCRVTGKGQKFLERMRNRLCIITTLVKVFEPAAEADSGFQLLAVMGPEGCGKSTLINHILHKGQDKIFMPAAPGMGTQVVCKIAKGPLDTLQTTSDEFPKAGDVNGMIEEINQKIKDKRELGAQLRIRDVEMLRATVRFEAPFAVQFLDVPGTKPETLFHTHVALGLATTLVLVCGHYHHLRDQLNSGDLVLLKEAVKGLNQPIPIQCLASFKIEKNEFDASKHQFRQILAEHFPTCAHLIKEPLFMNFYKAQDDAQRQGMVENFYAALSTAEGQVVDPSECFVAMRNEVETFTATLHHFFKELMKEYLETKIRSPQGAVFETGIRSFRYLAEMQSDLEALFNPENINHHLDRVKVGKLGVNHRHEAGSKFQEVKNVAFHVQSQLNQCRLNHMGWLMDCSKEFHTESFGNVFAPFFSDLERIWGAHANDRLRGAFKFCNKQKAARYKNSFLWWSQEYTSHIALYLDGTALGCLLTGFHLVSNDAAHKASFVGLPFSKRDREEISVVTANNNLSRDRIIKGLEKMNYSEWVTAVMGKMDEYHSETEELCKAIESACECFGTIALEAGFLRSPRDNFAMESLVDTTFVLLERIFVESTEESDGEHTYTKFAEHLRTYSSKADLKRKRPVIEGEDLSAAVIACWEALQVMQESPSVSATWNAKFRNGVMKREIEKVQMLHDMLGPNFTLGHDGAMLLVPQDCRQVLQQSGETAYPTAAQALKILDFKFRLRADAKTSTEFAPYALSSIQWEGARVAIFMRRGDIVSYDPLHEEVRLLEMLHREPNFVILFVLWTPAHPDTEWNTPHFTQRWKNASSIDLDVRCLDVRLIPMQASFDCRKFVDEEVAEAIRAADAKAQISLGRIRETEKELRLNFANEVDKYEEDSQAARNADPNLFHTRMNEMREELKNKMRDIQEADDGFDIPLWEFHREHFTPATLQGDDFLEFECRSLLFHIMLGQCMQKCSQLAAAVYDKVLTKILDEICGKAFFMTGSRMVQELDDFCKRYKNVDDFQAEVETMNLLRLMIKKESFQHMYVGCVSHMLMPALYATVLPVLLKGTGGKKVVTDEVYKHNLKFAKEMLEGGVVSAHGRRRRRSVPEMLCSV